MVARWLIRCGWRPFELLARNAPPWPLSARLEEPVPGVVCVRIENGMTRALSRLAGGYDYAVLYILHGSVMIDTGYPWAARALRRVIVSQSWNTTVRTVINTHYHEDHIGNNDVVAELTGARFLGGDATTAEVRLPARLPWYRRFLFGPVFPLRPIRMEVAPSRLEVDGLGLECLETPGHCPGHLCVFVPETGWLFSGDLFVAPDLDTQLPDVDGPAWIRSLEQVLTLPVTALFDAHGTVILGEAPARQALQLKLEFLREIRRRVEVHLEEASSLEDLTHRVFPARNCKERLALGDGWLSVWTGADFSRYHLVRSFARDLLATRNV